jgi:outer membrane protein assembly factor BamA
MNTALLSECVRGRLPSAVLAMAALAGPISGIAGVRAAGGMPQNASATTSAAQQGGPNTAILPGAFQGYRLGEIRVTGARILPGEFIRSSLGLAPGEIYDEAKLRKGLEAFKELYGEQGYVTFLPMPVFEADEQRKILNLTVNIEEGLRYFLNRLGFTGITAIPDQVLRREIPLTEGDVFNSRVLKMSVSRLNQLGLFEEIKIEDFQITFSPNEPKVDVILRVQEKTR